MVFCQCILQILHLLGSIFPGTGYVLMTCHILYLSFRLDFEPIQDHITTDMQGIRHNGV